MEFSSYFFSVILSLMFYPANTKSLPNIYHVCLRHSLPNASFPLLVKAGVPQRYFTIWWDMATINVFYNERISWRNNPSKVWGSLISNWFLSCVLVVLCSCCVVFLLCCVLAVLCSSPWVVFFSRIKYIFFTRKN